MEPDDRPLLYGTEQGQRADNDQHKGSKDARDLHEGACNKRSHITDQPKYIAHGPNCKRSFTDYTRDNGPHHLSGQRRLFPSYTIDWTSLIYFYIYVAIISIATPDQRASPDNNNSTVSLRETERYGTAD